MSNVIESKLVKRGFFDRALNMTAFASGSLALVVAMIPSLYSHFNEPAHRANVTQVTAPTQSSNNVITPTAGPISGFNRDKILSDSDRRISETFIIPKGLQKRVAFWFDVYSLYDSEKRVIHHSLYPWIIFKVVDVNPIISASYPKFRWMRNQIADTLVKKETANIRKAIDSISKKRRSSDLENARLSADEIAVRDALLSLGPDVRRSAKRARREVRVQMGQKNFMAEGLQTAPQYFDEMEAIFKKYKLPIELTRLPLVESSFKTHAASKVGAVGIWQFMESTGRAHKLIINPILDERRSIYKSTTAAAILLKENHMILHRSWALALTAWNHGPSGVRVAYRAAGTKDLSRIIELYHSKTFSFASENFYAEFLAALYTERYSDQIFPGLPRHAPLAVDELKLTRSMKFEDVARVAAVSVEDFISMNPDFSRMGRKGVLQKGLRIYVPSEARAAIEDLMTSRKPVKRLIGANG